LTTYTATVSVPGAFASEAHRADANAAAAASAAAATGPGAALAAAARVDPRAVASPFSVAAGCFGVRVNPTTGAVESHIPWSAEDPTAEEAATMAARGTVCGGEARRRRAAAHPAEIELIEKNAVFIRTWPAAAI
jgi:hypothetical protein